MYKDTIFDITSKLQAWRASVINNMLAILAVAAFPVIVCVIIEEIRRPEEWLATLIFVAVYLLIVGLAFVRRLGFRLRAWGLVLLSYVAGSLAFARGGLAGDGRVYLLALPVLAMILINLRSGIVLAILSVLIYFAFAMIAHLGWMADWLVTTDNPLCLINWVVGGLFFALALTTLVAIQWFFHQLQRDIITENVRLFEESERLRVFNENIVQGMNEGVFIEDTTGRITFVNPKAAELLDDSPENLIGRHWKTFVAPDHLAKVQEESDKRPQGATSLYETVLLVRGKRVSVIISARPLFEDERFTGVLTVVTDVTELRRAEESLRQYTAQLEALRQVGLELTAQLDLDALLNSIVSHAHELLRGTSSGLYLYRPEQDVLEWSVSIGPDTAPVGTTLRWGEGLSGKVWETGQPLIVDDYGQWEEKSPAWEQYPVASVVGVPVHWGDEFLGVLNVGARASHPFSQADAELLSLFAAQAAITIQNARLYEQAQHEIDERRKAEEETLRLAAQAALIYEVGQSISGKLELDELSSTIVNSIRDAFDYYGVALFLLDEQARCLTRQSIAGGQVGIFSKDLQLAIGEGMTGYAAETGKTQISGDVSQDPHYVYKAKVETKSELAVPIKRGQKVIGVLDLQCDKFDAFDEADVMIMGILAEQSAVAIENAQLYAQAQREITAREQMMEALQKSEERLRLIIQNMPVMLDAFDADDNIVFWNRECEQVTGYSAEEIISHPNALELLYPDAAYFDHIMAEWEERGNIFRDWELKLTSKDGSLKTVAWSTISEQIPIPGWATWSIGVDVTDREQAEQALRVKDAAMESAIMAIALADLEGKLTYVNRAFLAMWGYNERQSVLGKHAADFWQVTDQVAVVIQALEEVGGWVGKLGAKRKDGATFPALVSASMVEDDAGRPVQMMASFVDMTYREDASEMLQRHVERLEILRDIDGAILAAKSPEEIAQAALSYVRWLVPCRRASVALFDFEANEGVVLAVQSGDTTQLGAGARFSLEGAEEEKIKQLRQGKVVLVEDVQNPAPTAVAVQAMQAEGLRSYLAIPLCSQKELMGVLGMWSDRTSVLGPEHALVAQEVANSLTIAIQHANLLESVIQQRERLRTLTVRLTETEEAERTKLSQVLHDEIGQNLTVLGLNLNLIRAQLAQETSSLVLARLDDSLALVEATTERIRHVMTDLQPPMLDDYGLIYTLRWYGDQFASRTGVGVTMQGEETIPRLAAPVENVFFRITQEALTNVVKHAKASQVTINVKADDQGVRLVIADDGVGFDQTQLAMPSQSQGWGLSTMKERAEAIGARCRIESHPQQGTQVIVEMAR